MATIRTSVESQSKALSDAAGEILAQPKVPERRYVPLSAADAVLRYASDFIPSWAGAIAIDLLPAVLVGVMAVAHGAARRDEETLEDADRVTAADLFRALELNAAMQAKHGVATDAQHQIDELKELVAEAKSQQGGNRLAENVTPLSDRKRAEP